MKFLLLFSLILSSVAYSVTIRKVLVEAPITGCDLDAQDDVNIRKPMVLPALGIITGTCADTAWGSGLNWTNGYTGLRTGQVDTTCDRQTSLQITYVSPNGRAGFLDAWDSTPTGAGANPCTHNGRFYRKYEAQTNP